MNVKRTSRTKSVKKTSPTRSVKKTQSKVKGPGKKTGGSAASALKNAGFTSGPGKRAGAKGAPRGSSADPNRKSSGAGTAAQRNSLRKRIGTKKK